MTKPSRRGPSRRRRGLGLIEMGITGVLLAVAMVATVQVISWVAHERKSTERRQRALAEASNLMERINALPWLDLDAAPGKVELSETTRAFLPGAKLDIRVTPVDEAPGRKRIKLEITWRDRSGRPESPVRVVAWVHERSRGAR